MTRDYGRDPMMIPAFFDELSEGRLMASRCRHCDSVLLPPRPACYACGSRDLALEEQPRSGNIISYTEVRSPPKAFEQLAPYSLAIVELNSGARLTGRVNAPYDEIAIGDQVRLAVEDAPTDVAALAPEFETEWPVHVFEPI